MGIRRLLLLLMLPVLETSAQGPAPQASQAPEPQPAAAVPAPETQEEPAPEPQPLVTTVTPPTPKLYMAPNPPSCALEFTDTAYHLTKIAVDITLETKICAWNMGWLGQTPFGDKEVWPFHKDRACTGLILATISLVGAVVADIEAIMFDCFNNNQACGQSIAHAAQFLISAANSLVTAGAVCEPPGKDPPFYSVHDVPVKGFICWATIWHSIQRILRASKFIDVALLSCESAPPVVPDEVAPPAPVPVPDEAADEDAEASANSTLLGAWGGLGTSSLPFHSAGLEAPDVPPEERRRLSAPGGPRRGAEEEREAAAGSGAEARPDAEGKLASLAQAKERIARILHALGHDGVMEDLEPLQDVEQIKQRVMSVVGPPPGIEDIRPEVGTHDDNVSNIRVNDSFAVWV